MSRGMLLLRRPPGQLVPHLSCLGLGGTSSHIAQVFLKRFEQVYTMEAKMRPFAGNQLSKGFKELIVIVFNVLKNDRARPLGAR